MSKSVVEEEVTEAVDSVVEESTGQPDPIHPQSTPDQREARVAFEVRVNAQAEQFAQAARDQFIDATLAGKAIFIVVKDNED